MEERENMKSSASESCEVGDEGTNKKPVQKIQECEFCGREFNSGNALGGHKRLHLQALRRKNEAKDKEKGSNVVENSMEEREKMKSSAFESCEVGDEPKGDEGTNQKPVKEIHKCDFGWREFNTGNALGGHKRLHLQALRKKKEAKGKGIKFSASDRKLIRRKGQMLLRIQWKREKMKSSTSESCEVGDEPKGDEGTNQKPVQEIHKCEFFGREFNSGNALGGHKRLHLQALRKKKKDKDAFDGWMVMQKAAKGRNMKSLLENQVDGSKVQSTVLHSNAGRSTGQKGTSKAAALSSGTNMTGVVT
ncbi:uncharacterized protein LOC133290039 [Gastrolobium bilobum]|uniref:uncharacterized protein LOC133290039 n=1 Tax=Gastrolobium bilobum TaxID=150636 RepID=UPI002AB2A6F5|nr:uncharacterized protein LOC133290039 [Gastrolobium bilobum]